MRNLAQRLIAGLLCLTLATPGWGQGPPPPEFPPGTQVGPPPGFDGQAPKDKDDQASQIGAILANVGYGLAGIFAFFSIKHLPHAWGESAEAVKDLRALGANAEQAKRLKEWGEHLEKINPVAMKRLEDAHDDYRRRTAGLAEALAAATAKPGSREDIKSNAEKILELPLLQRRPKVLEELGRLVKVLKETGDPLPLEQWLADHKDYDAVRTKNGQAWLERHRALRRQAAGKEWLTSGSTLAMERWLASPAAGAGEQQAFKQLRAAEQAAAETFVREVNAAMHPMFDKSTRPVVSLLPEGAREPGQFLFSYAGGGGALDSKGVIDEAATQCGNQYAAVMKQATSAAAKASVIRPLGQLLWPFVPTAGTAAVSGYYSVEGVSYWLGGSKKAAAPSDARK